MQLSIEIYTLRKRYGDQKAIEMLSKAGFDCVDYSFYWLDDSDDAISEKYIEHAKKIKRILDANQITCNQAHAPLGYGYVRVFDVSDKEYQKIVRSMEAAAIMGANSIIIHAVQVPEHENLFEYNLRFYKSLEPYAEQFGIHIAIENLWDYDPKRKRIYGRLHTPDILYKMLDALQSPWFIICIDVGHAAMTGYEPEEIIRQFDNKALRALHIHDNDYCADKHALPYTGDFNWNEIMKALKEIDYQGEFTLEIFKFLESVDDDFMEEALKFAEKTGRYLAGKCKN